MAFVRMMRELSRRMGAGKSRYAIAIAVLLAGLAVIIGIVSFIVPPDMKEEQIVRAYEGWNQRYNTDGKIVKPEDEGGIIVSEGQAYGLLFAVQTDDRDTFDEIERWTYDTMDRRNEGTTAEALNLMGWQFDPNGNPIDWMPAADADIDRVTALLYAHARWGSAGEIDYYGRAIAIADDMKEYLFVPYEDMQVMLPFLTEAENNAVVNVSYFNIPTFRLLYHYTEDQFWLDAVEGAYYVIERDQSEAGLFRDWSELDLETGEVREREGLLSRHGWDAFRTLIRLYWDWVFYEDPRAREILERSAEFFADEYDEYGRIAAEYDHDGVHREGYELNLFTWAAYFALEAAGKEQAGRLYDDKLADRFVDDPRGAYFSNHPDQGYHSYYGTAWTLFGEMTEAGMLENYAR